MHLLGFELVSLQEQHREEVASRLSGQGSASRSIDFGEGMLRSVKATWWSVLRPPGDWRGPELGARGTSSQVPTVWARGHHIKA